jgi:DNA-binding Lrp family transcriptional regulator
MTASDRREEVIRLLSNVDTTTLADREIARMVGVSPQTVGNIRRRIIERDVPFRPASTASEGAARH